MIEIISFMREAREKYDEDVRNLREKFDEMYRLHDKKVHEMEQKLEADIRRVTDIYHATIAVLSACMNSNTNSTVDYSIDATAICITKAESPKVRTRVVTPKPKAKTRVDEISEELEDTDSPWKKEGMSFNEWMASDKHPLVLD